MPELEPDPFNIRWYFRIGLALLVPVAVVFFIFGTAALNATALESAKPCAVNTQDQASSCLSRFQGTVTEQTFEGKSPTQLAITVGASTVHVGWTCFSMSPSVCRATSLPAGTNVITEWWRGKVVRLGPAEGQPLVVTDADPENDAATRAPFLIVALLAIVPLLLSGLMRQAPMSVNQLIDSFFALVPGRSVPATRWTIWRVALGAWGWLGIPIWWILYFAYFVYAAGTTRTLYAALAWLCAGLIGFALAGVGAYVHLARMVQNSKRQAVVVQKVRRGVGRNRTQVWYDLPDGTSASTSLGGEWSNLGHKGLQIDALTDQRTGKVRRILGKAPT